MVQIENSMPADDEESVFRDPEGVRADISRRFKRITKLGRRTESELAPRAFDEQERDAELLDMALDVLDDAGVGLYLELVPNDAIVEWATPRKLMGSNGIHYAACLSAEQGFDLSIVFGNGDWQKVEHGISLDELAATISLMAGMDLSGGVA